MNCIRKIILICAVSILACSAPEDQPQQRTLDEGPPLKSVHLLNLSSEIIESQYVSALSELNKAISDLGYPDSGYRLWKVQGDSDTEYIYLMEGNWPSQAAYDKIHESEIYLNAVELFQANEKLKDIEQVYLRYSEVAKAVTNR